jgi:hypothetical protein
MERNMNDIDYQQIIKWIIIVIVVGFPGQFGGSFAPCLIERVRKKKAHAASEKSEVSVSQPAEQDQRKAMIDTTEAQGKAEKRAAMALDVSKKEKDRTS